MARNLICPKVMYNTAYTSSYTLLYITHKAVSPKESDHILVGLPSC